MPSAAVGAFIDGETIHTTSRDAYNSWNSGNYVMNLGWGQGASDGGGAGIFVDSGYANVYNSWNTFPNGGLERLLGVASVVGSAGVFIDASLDGAPDTYNAGNGFSSVFSVGCKGRYGAVLDLNDGADFPGGWTGTVCRDT